MVQCCTNKRTIGGAGNTPMVLTKTTCYGGVVAEGNPTRKRLVGELNPNWKGGKLITEHGYVLIRVGVDHPLADVRGYAYEHRLRVWEAGQDVNGKHVHHGDENRQRNEADNLEALTPAEHRFLHRKPDSDLRLPGEPNRTVFCLCGCGAEFLRFDSVGRPRDYISGHNTERKNPLIECKCGCGCILPKFNTNGNEREYVWGHKPKPPNPIVECGCGCGAQFEKYDSSRRPRRFISGHNGHDDPTRRLIVQLLESGISRVKDIIEKSGKSESAISSAIDYMHKTGIIEHICHGHWRLINGKD